MKWRHKTPIHCEDEASLITGPWVRGKTPWRLGAVLLAAAEAGGGAVVSWLRHLKYYHDVSAASSQSDKPATNYRDIDERRPGILELATDLREDFTITEKAPSRAFLWLKAPISAFETLS